MQKPLLERDGAFYLQNKKGYIGAFFSFCSFGYVGDREMGGRSASELRVMAMKMATLWGEREREWEGAG